MLYLEDYLEMIENLPQELRDRFTDMREMDLTVQNNIDTIEKRIRVLFTKCARSELIEQEADEEYKELHGEYTKILDDADEKISLANQMYDLVERYLRRLDNELFKFKCELEADHNGITEILEKRSLELEGGTGNGNGNVSANNAVGNNALLASSQKENRFFGMLSNNNGNSNAIQNRERYRSRPEKRRNSSTSSAAPPEKRLAVGMPSTSAANVVAIPSTPTTAAMSPSHPSALTSNASFNILATPNANNTLGTPNPSTPQGRRGSTVKNFDPLQVNSSNSDISLNRDMPSTPSTPGVGPSSERDANSIFNSQRRHKKKIPGMNMPPGSQLPPPGLGLKLQPGQSSAALSGIDPTTPSVVLGENGLVVEQTTDGEWSYDPNEPRYCICNQVSYGDMVACDNEACPFEWFHYPCVGITQSPKGKWYCPKCTASMKRRGIRK